MSRTLSTLGGTPTSAYRQTLGVMVDLIETIHQTHPLIQVRMLQTDPVNSIYSFSATFADARVWAETVEYFVGLSPDPTISFHTTNDWRMGEINNLHTVLSYLTILVTQFGSIGFQYDIT